MVKLLNEQQTLRARYALHDVAIMVMGLSCDLSVCQQSESMQKRELEFTVRHHIGSGRRFRFNLKSILKSK